MVTKMTEVPIKQFLRDRLILLLLSVLAFATLVAVLLVLVRLNAGHGESYIAQYRESLGINAFKTGSIIDLFSFVVFAVLVGVGHTLVSLKVYAISRQVALTVLTLGILLLLFGIVISNALLVLR